MNPNIPQQPDPEYNRRMMIALLLSVIVMVIWYAFVDAPQRQKLEVAKQVQLKDKAVKEAALKQQIQSAPQNYQVPSQAQVDEDKITGQTREQIIAGSPRIKVDNGKMHGSIALTGSRIDDITLAKYRQKLAKNSPEVVLMSPSGVADANFIEIGWASGLSDTAVPNKNTIWQVVSGDVLTPAKPIELKWDNGAGLVFHKKISVDDNYMFTFEQSVVNNSGKNVLLSPYGLISKTEAKDPDAKLALLHLGPIGVSEGKLIEASYGDIRDDGNQSFQNTKRGWLGISDKYWLKALVPQDKESYEINFRRVEKNGTEKFQVDYLGKQKELVSGQILTFSTQVFAGAKELKLLEKYSERQHIPLFDRAIHFGWFYFLSKPMSEMLTTFYAWVGNFGVAILMLVFVVKLLLFPLARKSYIAMGKMRILQPKMLELKKTYSEDRVALQQKMLELYRKEKVNPAAGCLPILLQIPIFLALYRVIFTSIEMRHAPFFGWIQDLSAPDPTSWWNLFGLLPYHGPEFLAIGIWPLIMGLTMYIQQTLMPAPTDPIQAQVIKFMPVLFLVMFHSFPAGLIIYWAFSNTMTIAQQIYFLRISREK